MLVDNLAWQFVTQIRMILGSLPGTSGLAGMSSRSGNYLKLTHMSLRAMMLCKELRHQGTIPCRESATRSWIQGKLWQVLPATLPFLLMKKLSKSQADVHIWVKPGFDLQIKKHTVFAVKHGVTNTKEGGFSLAKGRQYLKKWSKQQAKIQEKMSLYSWYYWTNIQWQPKSK